MGRREDISKKSWSLITHLTLEASRMTNKNVLGSDSGIHLLLSMITLTEAGVRQVRKTGCDLLLNNRLETKLRCHGACSILKHLNSRESRSMIHTNTLISPVAIKGISTERDCGVHRKSQENRNQIKGPNTANDFARGNWQHDLIPDILDG